MYLDLTPTDTCHRNECPKIIQMLFDGTADEFAKYVQEHTSELENMTPDRTTALLCAVYHKKDEQARALVRAGANVNHQDSYGRTALIFAVYSSAQLVRMLLLEGVGINVNLQDNDGYTVLIHTLHNSHPDPNVKLIQDEIVGMLLQHPDINVNLYHQAAHCHTALMTIPTERILRKLLLVPNINVNMQNSFGRTALMLSVGYAEITCILLKRADINIYKMIITIQCLIY